MRSSDDCARADCGDEIFDGARGRDRRRGGLPASRSRRLSGRRAPLHLSPPTPSADPTPIPSGPISGIGFSVVDDPATFQVVLFGGVDNYANTWIWSGHWILAAPSDEPSGRIDAAIAYDPLTQQVLLFGGRQAP